MPIKSIVLFAILTCCQLSHADIRESREVRRPICGEPLSPNTIFYSEWAFTAWFRTHKAHIYNPRKFGSPLRWCGWAIPKGEKDWVIQSVTRRPRGEDEREWMRKSQWIEGEAIK